MKVWGSLSPGSRQTTLGTGDVRLARFRTAFDGYAIKLSAYMGGQGGGSLPQLVRGVLYDDLDNLIDYSDALTILPGDAPDWLDFELLTPGGVATAAGRYRVGVQGGPSGGTAVIFGDPASISANLVTATGSYGAAPPDPLASPVIGAGDVSAFVTWLSPWLPPQTDDLAWYAALPHDDAQQVLATPPLVNLPVVTCGWYSVEFDPDIPRGSFALVNPSGPLAAHVGDRLRLTTGGSINAHSVVVLVADQALIAEDIAVSRRAFMDLALLAAGSVSTRVALLS